jgi:hypothetical protein
VIIRVDLSWQSTNLHHEQPQLSTPERAWEVNPDRKDGALNPTLSKMDIVCFYHPRRKWRGFLTG